MKRKRNDQENEEAEDTETMQTKKTGGDQNQANENNETEANGIKESKREPSLNKEVVSPRAKKNICKVCDKQVLTKEPGIECQFCKFWFHGPCQNVKTDEIRNIQKLKTTAAVLWPCISCRNDENNSEKQIKDKEKKYLDLKKKYEKNK